MIIADALIYAYSAHLSIATKCKFILNISFMLNRPINIRYIKVNVFHFLECTSAKKQLTNCIDKEFEVIVRQVCDKRQKCVVSPQGFTANKNKKCKKTKKYLEIQYSCLGRNGECLRKYCLMIVFQYPYLNCKRN